MSPSPTHSLSDVLAVARMHPFYCSAKYPPDDEAIQDAREKAALKSGQSDLRSWPLLQKRNLYTVIERLINDTNPDNKFRKNVYTSVTGGGGGVSKPLFFATDALENRRQRALFGEFLKKLGIIEPGDWVLSTHHGGGLYRSLDLTLEILENAGASVLAAGHHCTPSTNVQVLQDFNVNVLTGDSSQIVSIVHQISTMPDDEKNINVNKIIYTSEGLSAMQRTQIYKVLGPVAIYSLLGSAEAGPYGASSPFLIDLDPAANYNDFIIDTRMTIIEILPLFCAQGQSDRVPEPVPEGETGVIAQTVLTRLRHPVIRYITGDIGSLHHLPRKAVGRIAKQDVQYYHVLRLHGRDQRFSFMWDGCDFQLEKLTNLLLDPQMGVLLWQVILDKMALSKEVSLEIRLLCGQSARDTKHLEEIVGRLKVCLDVSSSNEHKFKTTFVEDAVSSSLPTWESVVSLSERDEESLEGIDYSYPRFFINKPLRALIHRVKERLDIEENVEICFIYPSAEIATVCATKMRSASVEPNPEIHTIRFSTANFGTQENKNNYLSFSLVLLPPDLKRKAMMFWTNLGAGITNRHAEYCVEHFNQLGSFSLTAKFNTSATVTPLQDPSSETWLQNGPKDMQDLKAYIAQLSTSERTDLKAVKAEDVFIFPTGMNAISTASEAIARLNPDSKVVAYGNIKFTSPNLQRIRQLADEYELIVACDETVGNFINVDLLSFVDVIMTSLTKMFSGAANVTGGRLVCCFPKDIQALKRNSVNMAERVQKANENALMLVDLFGKHPSVAQVNHPSRGPTSQNYEKCRRQNGGYSNVCSVVFQNPESAQLFYNELDVCKGSSFGTNFTLVIPFVQLAVCQAQEKCEEYGLPRHVLRISVGLEDTSEICSKMSEALAEIERFERMPRSVQFGL
ncbi:hypothetical protein FBEOM_9866 [Fusarium beomiforme]|uniref:Cystathionine beta-lyase n=1 Tax=Fusarium beomiforme TaxID=44412 RepID=A0A9P5AE54_9HYPO|nr:hypothetical protein FBEOM_9866 [Fusarium beomiforme]